MIGKVTTWQMNEEERQAYIAKHPIRTSPDMNLKRQSAFVHIYEDNKRRAKKHK